MKSIIYAVVAATALSASYGAFAQSSQVTREQVRAELVQLEQAGYRPEVADLQYPQALQTAQARVANADAAGYGAQAAAGVRAGRVVPVTQNGPGSTYFGQ